MAVDITSIAIELDTSSVKAGAADIDKAAKSGDRMAASFQAAGQQTEKGLKGAEVAMKSNQKVMSSGFSGIGSSAGRAGIQIQQFVGQIQGGQSAFLAFSQQSADLGIVLGAPMVGVLLSLGAVLAGTLMPSLASAGEAVEHMSDNVKGLVKDLNVLSDAQKGVVNDAIGLSIEDQRERMAELTTEIDEQIKSIAALNEMNGKSIEIATGERSVRTIQIDNTEKLADATKELTANKIALVTAEREVAELQDTTGAAKRIRELSQEAELIGLVGDELYRAEAAQKGYSEGQAQEYIALNLFIEAQKEGIKSSKDSEAAAIKEALAREKAAVQEIKRIDEIEKKRQQSVASLNAGMNREIALMGNASKETALLYDITNGFISAKGKEAQQLLATAAALDVATQAYREQEEVISMLDEFGDIEAFDNLAEQGAESIGNMFERIDQAASDAWVGMFDGFDGMMSGVQDLFKRTLAEMAHEALTKPIIMNIQQSMTAGGTSAAQGGGGAGVGALGAGGIYAAAAIAVVAAVQVWNKEQDEKYAKMTAEYRQGTQSMGTLLGSANEKSDSINHAIDELSQYADDSLSVNRGMLDALIDIRTGIAGVAAGFSRTLTGLGKTNTFTGTNETWADISGGGNASASLGITRLLGKIDFIDGGLAEILGGLSETIFGEVSKAIYSKKTKIIDSGIEFGRTTLADIISEGAINAFAFADIQTKKKVLGVTSSTKVKTETEALDEILVGQLSDVFSGAGEVLGFAAEAFGLEFDNYIDKLIVDPQKLSLKDLSGDALTQEIESFFSATLDNWAGVLVDGSTVLKEFQQIGEGAFETVIRLASELNQFSSYAEALNLDFGLVGFSAVQASQNIANAAGGFDQLNASMAGYYNNFFDDSERAERQMGLLSNALGEIGINTVPASREAFRSLVEGIDLATESGQQQFGALINLQGVFAELVPATEALAAASRSASDIAAERYNLETQLLTLHGNTNELRERERVLLDESNQALYDQIKNYEDSSAAFKERTESEKALADAALSAAQASASEILNLNKAYFDLTATEAEKRNAILESLLSDEARSIQNQVFAWQDAQAAASAAADATRELAAEQQKIANERYGLETQLLQLQGNTQALRNRELELLDESNRGLQLEIYATQDKIEADELAAKAAQEYASAQSKAQEDAINAAKRAAEEQKRLAEGVHDSISSALKSLMGQSDTLTAMSHARARSTLQSALSVAQAGGSLVGFSGLEDALGAIQNGGDNFASGAEARLAQGRNIGLLSELEKYTRVDGSHANGLDRVPYDGYVAQLHAGERVQTASQAKSQDALVAEVRALRAEIQAGNIAIAKNTGQSAKILTKWDGDGMPDERDVA